MTHAELATIRYGDPLWLRARGRRDHFTIRAWDTATGKAWGRRLDYSNTSAVTDMGDVEVDIADLELP